MSRSHIFAALPMLFSCACGQPGAVSHPVHSNSPKNDGASTAVGAREQTPNEEELCARLAAARACPDQTTAHREVAILSEEGSQFCLAWCARPDGTRHGPYLSANLSTGVAHEQGQYVDGQRAGTWQSWNRVCPPDETCPDRVLLTSESYRADVLHGAVERRFPDGQLAERGAWYQGQRDGLHERWNDRGELMSRGRFARGTPVGVHESWWSAEQLAARDRYDERGRPDGEQCRWARTGKPIACFTLSAGTGTMKEYEEDQLVAEIPMRDGVPHGVERRFEPFTREPVAEIHHRRGVRHGRTRNWQNGCLKLDASFHDGELHGRYVKSECDEATARPRMTRAGRYCRGEPCGTWTERTSDGSHKRVYRHGAGGQVVAEKVWSDGQLLESWDLAADRRREHRRCLAELARGGCCDPEQHPPRGARLCENGDKVPNQ